MLRKIQRKLDQWSLTLLVSVRLLMQILRLALMRLIS